MASGAVVLLVIKMGWGGGEMLTVLLNCTLFVDNNGKNADCFIELYFFLVENRWPAMSFGTAVYSRSC